MTRKRITVALRCNECGTKFRVSPNAVGPYCPTCDSFDWDVLDSPRERDDDDGRTYADPRTEREERLR
jgi:ribosomal protein L44E